MAKITWVNEKRKLKELLPWKRNPRQIKKDQAERLVESFDEFGQVETIAVGPKNDIYNGHQRLNVLLDKYGGDYEVEVRVSSRNLSEKEREKLTVFLHKGAAGEFNFDILANEFEIDELLSWGFEEHDLGVFPSLPNLEELKDKYDGDPDPTAFWPVIKITVDPDTKFRFDQIIRNMPGSDELEKFISLLDRIKNE